MIVTERFRTLVLDQDVLAVVAQSSIPVAKITNQKLRFAAYRQFIYWVYQTQLLKRIRKVVPSCVVWAIRDRYPDDTYTGHKAADELEPFIE